jgi:hypothetical protein
VHLDLAGAWAQNPLLVVCLPYILYHAVAFQVRLFSGRRFPTVGIRPFVLWALLLSVLLYWLARNIPVEPFLHLAPG